MTLVVVYGLTSAPGKIMEKNILWVTEKHLKVIGHSQDGLTRGNSCLTNLISFDEKVTHLVDHEKLVYVVFLDFYKAFNTVSQSMLLDKMSSIHLDKHIVEWVNNGLMGEAQRIVVNGVTSDWWPVTSGVGSPGIHFGASSL